MEEGIIQQSEFLKEWPVSRLESMTLEEYTNLDKDNSFTYWIESRTDKTGSIWGGSSYKFGIYRRKDTEAVNNKSNLRTDGEYAWYSKYGNDRHQAFGTVKSLIISIAKNSQSKKFSEIDAIDLGEAFKWKIAFMYNPNHLIPIFSREMLDRIVGSLSVEDLHNAPVSSIQQYLMSVKAQDQSTLDFASELWSKYDKNKFYYVIERFLKQAKTSNLKKQGYPKQYKGLDVSVSFGVGNTARIPWIALLKEPNKVMDGIYPVYLYYKEIETLILAYGKSETHTAYAKWPNENYQQTIEEWYLKHYNRKPDRYGGSLVKTVYDLKNGIDDRKLQSDLDGLIDTYKSMELTHQALVEEKTSDYQSKKYWLVSPGEGAREWDRFYKQGIVGLGWDEIKDLKTFDDREDVRNELLELYPGASRDQKNNSLALWEFRSEISPGDIIIAKKGRREYLGYGVIDSDYQYVNGDPYPHQRKVDWKIRGSWPDEVGEIVLKTLTDITKYPSYVDRLKRLIGIGQEAVIPKKVSHWWLNANPKYWRIEDFELGQDQTYTTHNEKGNKRNRYAYFQQVKPGDLVIGYASTPVKKVVALFEITRGLFMDEDAGEESISFKILKFLPDPIPWSELQEMEELRDSEVLKNNQGSLFKLTPDEYAAITGFSVEEESEEYSREDALRELFIQDQNFDQVITSLEHKKNIILQGPPGTGKTFMAKRLAYAVIGEKDASKIEMVQFHQSYSYEDFIQGYRPNDDGSFRLENGVFYRFCKRAQADPNKKYFFIIDEINRGNLSKIFGELMLLIEKDKRGEEYAISLTYSQTAASRFYIPENIYIIGTMNTADRSLALVDYALRRRFAFINVFPNFKNKFKELLLSLGIDEAIIEHIALKMESLNQLISDDKNLGRGFQIGHSYFCNISENQVDDSWYNFIVDHEIRPLLEEYWYDDLDKAGSESERLYI